MLGKPIKAVEIMQAAHAGGDVFQFRLGRIGYIKPVEIHGIAKAKSDAKDAFAKGPEMAGLRAARQRLAAHEQLTEATRKEMEEARKQAEADVYEGVDPALSEQKAAAAEQRLADLKRRDAPLSRFVADSERMAKDALRDLMVTTVEKVRGQAQHAVSELREQVTTEAGPMMIRLCQAQTLVNQTFEPGAVEALDLKLPD
jgi:hypothetical protein